MINASVVATNIIVVAFFIMIFSFFALIIFLQNIYKLKQKRKYSYRNEFPYELLQGSDNNSKIVGYVLVLVFVISQIFLVFYALFDKTHFTATTLLISSVISSLATYFLFTTNINSMKKQMLLTSLLLTLTTVSSLMLGLFFLLRVEGTSFFIYVPAFILAAISLLLIINPALKRWAYMDKIVQQDGTIEILRPKYFPLAYSQWALIVINVLLLLLLFIGSFI